MNEVEAKIATAWDCVLSQQGSYLRQVSKDEGPGMGVFTFYPKPAEDETNCSFGYCSQNDEMWKWLLANFPYSERFKQLYTTEMYAACVMVPHGEEAVCSIKLFRFDDDEEIALNQ